MGEAKSLTDADFERLQELIRTAEIDAREFFAEADHTGERPDLHDTETLVYAEDLRSALLEITSLRKIIADAQELARMRRWPLVQSVLDRALKEAKA